ncbi:MAG: hypothetical protein U0930_10270 [Pirellulales bacterium]
MSRDNCSRRDFLTATAAGLLTTSPLAQPNSYSSGNVLPAGELDPLNHLDPSPNQAQSDWISKARDYQLPQWFESSRVHLHTRLTRSEANMGTKVAKSVKQMGANVFTRHVKSGDYGPFWPTKVGKPYTLAAERNFVAEMIEDAHSEGIKILGYYWITTDLAASEEHPEWLCRDANGKTIDASRHGNYLCLNSEYVQLVEARLLELVDMGIDGIYFDYQHMPRGGCWCDTCQRTYLQQTGRRLPRTNRTNEPEYGAHIDFTNQIVESAFLRWRKAIHTRRPDCVMVISGANFASTHTTHLSTHMFHLMDSNKTEFMRPYAYDEHMQTKYAKILLPERDAKLAFGFQLCRDATDGRPAHVWLPFMKESVTAITGVSGIVAHGCIAALDVLEKNFPDPILEPAINLAQKVSPAFTGTKAVRWAAVHFSEIARHRHGVGPRWDLDMWTNSSSRSFGAFQTVLRRRLPLGIITDSQLERGWTEGIEWIFLPNPEALTVEMQKAIRDFKQRGGTIVEHQASWNWYESEQFNRSTRDLASRLAPLESRSPMLIQGGPELMHANLFCTKDRGRFVVSLVNDFPWIQDQNSEEAQEAIAESHQTTISGVSVSLKLPQKAKLIREVVTEKTLESNFLRDRELIRVPDFQTLSVIEIILA